MTGTVKPLAAALAGQVVTPPPVWLMRQAGRYLSEYRAVRSRVGSMLELCCTPELACEVSLQPVRRFATDGVIVFSDILVTPWALGVELSFEGGEGPVLTPWHSAMRLRDHPDRLAPLAETLRLLRRRMPPAATLIGFAGAPWTLACYMIQGHGRSGFPAAMELVHRQDSCLAALTDILVTAVTDSLCLQCAAGAEAVMVFDSWAGLLPEAELVRRAADPVRRIIQAFRRSYPAVPVIVFPRGCGSAHTDYFRHCLAGGDHAPLVLSVDQDTPLSAVRARLPGQPLQGNLDPLVLRDAPLRDLRSSVRGLVAEMAGAPWIFNLGHGIHRQTDPERVAEVIACLRSPETTPPETAG